MISLHETSFLSFVESDRSRCRQSRRWREGQEPETFALQNFILLALKRAAAARYDFQEHYYKLLSRDIRHCCIYFLLKFNIHNASNAQPNLILKVKNFFLMLSVMLHYIAKLRN